MRELTIGKNDAGQRLDKFLSKTLYRMPDSLMYRYIRQKKVKVNRKRAEGNTRLCEGDIVQLFIKDEFFIRSENSSSSYGFSPKISVVYEDENIIVCDKRPGVLVHPDSSGDDRNTLLLHIKAYLFQKGEYDPEDEQSFAPSLCNRIDRNTGGLVIAAKNAAALREINRIIRDDLINKYYLCIVHGTFSKKSDTVESYLLKDHEKNRVAISDKPSAGWKKIITEYRCLETSDDLSLLEVNLLTGRTHQIRAHLAHIGHPLLGDGKYGNNRDDRSKGFKYQALYSYRIVFKNITGELSYLSNKEISVPIEDIWFCSMFKESFGKKRQESNDV